MRPRRCGRARGRTPGTQPGVRWMTSSPSFSPPSVLARKLPDRDAYLLGAEPALAQESRLPATLDPGRRKLDAEALAPDLGTAVFPLRRIRIDRHRDLVLGQPCLAQLVSDSDGSTTAIGMIRDEMLCVAGVIHEPLCNEQLDR